jgi:hypothetical protein
LILSEETSYRCVVDYVGAYAYWDLPSGEVSDQSRDFGVVESHVDNGDELPLIDRENDPPIAEVW